jgi:hypothetical protein
MLLILGHYEIKVGPYAQDSIFLEIIVSKTFVIWIHFTILALYKESPKTCHASVVVSIVQDLDALNNETTVALRRSLKNVKKVRIG